MSAYCKFQMVINWFLTPVPYVKHNHQKFVRDFWK